MYTLNNDQIHDISGGGNMRIGAAWITFVALTFGYYFLSNKEAIQHDSTSQDVDKRLSKLESLVAAQAEQLALLTSSNHTQL